MRTNYESSSLYAVVLAGGSGTRLWPRSRRERPKQLLPIFSQETMLQETCRRVFPIIQPDHIFVITNEGYVGLAREQLPEIPSENILGEPEGHGTAPAVGLASLHIHRIDPNAVMISLHADHYVRDADAFRQALERAAVVASQGYLVTLGIQPSAPETGYGYIERGDEIETLEGQPVYRVARFLEKPNLATATRFLEDGNHYWNSGIFAWKVTTLWREYARYQPILSQQLDEIRLALGTLEADTTLRRIWKSIADETIDVGIMEKSDCVTVLPINVGWSDVGSWATLLELLPANGDTNVVVGEHIGVDTGSSLLYSPKRLIATVGLANMIVVDTEDAILICPKERAQEVKHLVEALKKNNKLQYL